MATLARPSDDAARRVGDMPAGSPPATRRQSAEAIGLLLGILLVLLVLALAIGSPVGIGQ
jgi:hypothetical protein